MKKFKDISEFEDLLKDNLQGHSTPAPPDVWSSVAASTTQSVGLLSQATSFLSSTTNLLKVALFAGGIAAVGIVVYNENKNTDTASIPETTTEQQSPELAAEENNQETQNVDEELADTKVETSPKKIIRKKEVIETPQSLTKNKDTYKAETSLNPPSTKVLENEEVPVPERKTLGEKIVEKINSHFDISNTSPCKGESITVSQAKPTNWIVNDEVVAQNTKSHSIQLAKAGKLTVSNGTQTKTIQVSELTPTINTIEKEDGVYQFALEDNLIGNWYLDKELIETNASTINLTILNVGSHEVKATVVNHVCTTTAYKTITINPIGNITIYEIFTPDGDGKNDEYGVDISAYENFSIQIFDIVDNKRVFLSQNPDIKWNGKVNNEAIECKSGEYYAKISYKLKGESPQVKSIRLTLKR